MDISMPGMNGIQLTTRIHEMCPNTLVLALTRHTDSTYAQQIIQAGAQGYLLKQAAAKDLIVAIHTLAQGGVYLDSAVASRLLNNGSRQKSGAATEQALSERETEVIRMIALGYSNKEIAAELNLSIKTIDTYKARAQEKLQLYTRAALVRYALERGWLGND
jgi:DNA-binding NarL/FixJ family response regulator